MALEYLAYSAFNLVTTAVVRRWWFLRKLRKSSDPQVVRSYLFRRLVFGFSVPVRWRASIIDQGEVQQAVHPGFHGPFRSRTWKTKRALSSTAALVLATEEPIRLDLPVGGLFSEDSFEFSGTVALDLLIRPHVAFSDRQVLRSQLEAEVRGVASQSLQVALQRHVGSSTGEELEGSPALVQVIAEDLASILAEVLEDCGVEHVTVRHIEISNPFLKGLAKRQAGLHQERFDLELSKEQERVRGALRRAALSSRLAGIQDEMDFENTVKALMRDQELKEKALSLELEQSELDRVLERVNLWKNRQLAVLDAAQQVLSRAEAVTERWGIRLHEFYASSSALGLTATEKAQLEAALGTSRSGPVSLRTFLGALTEATGVPMASLDPFHRLYGQHTLRVGQGWQVLDEEEFWKIQLTSIRTRRHGFLWLRESPSSAVFLLASLPSMRQLESEFRFGQRSALQLGTREVPFRWVSGDSTRLTVELLRS